MREDLFFCDGVSADLQLLSLCFKSTPLAETARTFSVGDLLEVVGDFDDEVSRKRENDGRRGFLVSSVRLVSKFEGDVQFDWPTHVALDLARQPSFALQLDHQFVSRVLEYLACLNVSASVSTATLTYSNTRVVLVHDADEATAEILRTPSPLSQCLKRLYQLAFQSAGFAAHPDAVQAAAMALESVESLKDKKFRISCFPKEVTKPLIDHLTNERCCPKTFTHILYVVFANGLFYASVIPADRSFTADIFLTGCGQKTVSRAENKLEELVARAGLDLTYVKLAVDVGAAPGGWSNYLAELGVPRVIAVDNGEVRRSSPAVEHWKMLGHEAVEILKSQQAQIDLYVCDANIPPHVTLEIFTQALPLMRKDAIFVITLKNTCRSKEAFSMAIDQANTTLERLGLTNVAQIHLIANTGKETTVYGRI